MKRARYTTHSIVKNGFKVSVVAALVQTMLMLPNIAVAKDYNQITYKDGNISEENINIDSTQGELAADSFYSGIYIQWSNSNNQDIEIRSTGTGDQGDITTIGNIGIYSLIKNGDVLGRLPTLTVISNHDMTFNNQVSNMWNTNPSTITLQALNGTIQLNSSSQYSIDNIYSIYSSEATIKTEAQSNQLSINAPNATNKYFIQTKGYKYNSQWKLEKGNKASIVVQATTDDNLFNMDTNVGTDGGEIIGIKAESNSQIDLLASEGGNILQIGKVDKDINGKVGIVQGLYSNQAVINTNAQSNQLSINAPNATNKYLVYATGQWYGYEWNPEKLNPDTRKYGIWELNFISEDKSSIAIKATAGDNLFNVDTNVGTDGGYIIGAWADPNSQIDLLASSGGNILQIGKVGGTVNGKVSYVWGLYNTQGVINAEAQHNQLSINAPNAKNKYLIQAAGKAPNDKPNVTVNATTGDNLFTVDNSVGANGGEIIGVRADPNSQIDLLVSSGGNIFQIGKVDEKVSGKVSNVKGLYSNQAVIKAGAKSNQFSIYAPNAKNKYLIQAAGKAPNDKPNVTVNATTGDNLFDMDTNVGTDGGYIIGASADPNSQIDLLAPSGRNIWQIGEAGKVSTGKVKSVKGLSSNQAVINADAQENIISLNSRLTQDFEYYGVYSNTNAKISLSAANGDNQITLQAQLTEPVPVTLDKLNETQSYIRGLQSWMNSEVNLVGKNNRIHLQSEGDGVGVGYIQRVQDNVYTIQSNGILATNKPSETTATIEGKTSVVLQATEGSNQVDIDLKAHGEVYGVTAQHFGDVSLTAPEQNIVKVWNPDVQSPLMNLAKQDLIYRIGVYSSVNSQIGLTAANNSVTIGGNPVIQVGVQVVDNASATLEATTGNNTIDVRNAAIGSRGVSAINSLDGAEASRAAEKNNQVSLLATNGNNIITIAGSTKDRDFVEQSAVLKQTSYYARGFGSAVVYTSGGNSLVSMQAKNNLLLHSIPTDTKDLVHYSIYTTNQGRAELTAQTMNLLDGAQMGIYSDTGSSVMLHAQNNMINAAQHGISSNTNSIVKLEGRDNYISAKENGLLAQSNSEQHLIAQNTNEITGGKIGTFAVNGATIKVNGKDNLISASEYGAISQQNSQVTLEAELNKVSDAKVGLYANGGARLEVTGDSNLIKASQMATHSYTQGEVSVTGEMTIEAPMAAMSLSEGKIGLNYSKASWIKGELFAADRGEVAVKSKGSTLWLEGDGEAVNGGKIELQLTPRSTVIGRLDNFDAYQRTEHSTLFPFSRYVPAGMQATSSGQINLALMGDSLWKMTGQSWINRLSGEGTVDFNNPNGGRALHIEQLAGANRFLMRLNKDGAHSDMLYVKEGTATPQDVVIKNLPEVVNSMDYGDRLRFATVQRSQNEFVNGKVYATIEDNLFKQVVRVEYSKQPTDPDNTEAYNQAFNGQAMTKEKPSDSYVDSTYDGEDSYNVYLVRDKLNVPTENSKDMLKMLDATARYGFYLDTYTKREGQRAYSLGEIKEGAWARATHTRLKQYSDFRLNSNEYEIGYDKFRYNEAEKKQKWGLSFTYGHAKNEIDQVLQKGLVKKYMLSLYNTNQRNNDEGDNSYYNDNVLRVGALHSRYRSVMDNGVLWGSGSYKNYLFSASTEHGYRKFIDDDKRWYLVPQAQLQFAYLTHANYRTSNGIDVKLGSAKSLIGRVGMDVVRWLDESGDNRLYLKGNIMHEFLGKRAIQASDFTGNYNKTWNTRGTWYAVGVGYNAHVSEKTNVFIDAEKEFGQGRAGSYNLRLAISWQFK
ncbi:autotransporter outer membrane beta-barrel domain-containing protein [Gallibacterium melopsittaci]|uniref:Autotransporter outer membrane beta-barrel domain-containing protein n=1 Tax=Gallibacterium melopsittaci TaxID=516063 RepID=A0ABV6HYI9_9PAST